MDDEEKFIRCFGAKIYLDSVNNCESGSRSLWNCEQCPYDIPMEKFSKYLHEGRQYALQTTEQRIFRKELKS